MPIPRHVEKEFFIPNYNALIYDIDDTNEAIIDDYEDIFSYFPHFYSFSFTNHAFTHFSESSYLPNIWRFISDENNNDEFISEMSDIFYETVNNRNHSDDFRKLLIEFLQKQAICNDICILCANFISEIPLNNEIQNLLGNELTIDFIKKVSDFYEKSKKKKNRMEKKYLYKQFKEFKTHQSYFEKKFSHQMNDKIISKKMNLKSTHRKVKMMLLLNF